MRIACVLLSASFLALGLPSGASAASLGELIHAAGQSPDGVAKGPLDDPGAVAMQRKMGLTAHAQGTVQVIHHFGKRGCYRYRLTLEPLVAGKQPPPFNMEVNLCDDGSPPADAASYKIPEDQVLVDPARLRQQIDQAVSAAGVRSDPKQKTTGAGP
jgi:hypothetical protein